MWATVALVVGMAFGFALWRMGGGAMRAAALGAWSLGLGAAAAVTVAIGVLGSFGADGAPRVGGTPFLASILLSAAGLVAGVGAWRAGARQVATRAGLGLAGAVLVLWAVFLVGSSLAG